VEFSRGLKILLPLLLLLYGFGSGDPSVGNWLESAFCVALLVLSVAVHEFGHVLIVRRLGMKVRRVTLTAFGGLTEYEGVPPSPSAEGLIASAGPLASALLAAALLAVRLAVGGDDLDGVPSILTFGVAANVVITVVNLLPLPTLDGGKLTASIWKALTNRRA
jgi:Zn-dependent protease